ncbi:MAG: tyrosine-type recombinase/integrase [Dehalococcoidia bacterium]
MAPKARARGEGSIYQESSTGRWIAAFPRGYRNGRRYRERRIGSSEAEALLLLNEMRNDAGAGLQVDAERQTVAQFLHAWVEEVVKPRRRPKTYEVYASAIRLRIAPNIGPMPLKKLTGQDVQRFVNQLARTKLSPATVHQTYRVLHTALEKAREWKLLRDNPAEFVDPPAVPRQDRSVMSALQARAFLEATTGDRYHTLYLVALATSLRKGELLGLRWSDLDLEQGTLRVTHQLQRVDGVQQLVEVKTSTSRRTLAIAPSVVDALRAHKVAQAEKRLRAGGLWKAAAVKGLVFTTDVGTGLASRNVDRAFKTALSRCGECGRLEAARHPDHEYERRFPDMRWHDLRHTGASLLSAEGIPPRDLMGALGHAGIDVTMNVYAAHLPEGQRRIAATMEQLLRPVAH